MRPNAAIFLAAFNSSQLISSVLSSPGKHRAKALPKLAMKRLINSFGPSQHPVNVDDDEEVPQAKKAEETVNSEITAF